MLPGGGTIRLLVVEDSLTQAVKLRRDLESAGFEVEVARDAREGLDRFAASRFDLVLSDVVMPGHSGYDFCRRVKAGARGRDTPVILLTALREPRDIIQGLECGADNFLSKPYEVPHLVARIDALLARARRRQEPAHEGGVEIRFMGQQFSITAGKEQVLAFLASTFEDFVHAQRREQESRLAEQRQRLETEAARNREDLLRREKETLDGMLRDLVATQQELGRVNAELDRKVGELTRANLALREMNRLKGDFLATMSHELRTPLNSIIGFSEILVESGQLSERQERYAANIQCSGKVLLALINDILDAAKAESGALEARAEDFSARDACEALASAMQPTASRKGVELVCQLDEALPRVRQDAGKLRQILDNLLSNAIKFTPRGGRVTLRVSAEGTDLVVSVTDTGIGVAASDREKIFERFRQIVPPGRRDGALVREHPGTGLGLSIARDLARLLGGDVTLESRLGRGSTFTVRLPQQLSCHRRSEGNPPVERFDRPGARRVAARDDQGPREMVPVASWVPAQGADASPSPAGGTTNARTCPQPHAGRANSAVSDGSEETVAESGSPAHSPRSRGGPPGVRAAGGDGGGAVSGGAVDRPASRATPR